MRLLLRSWREDKRISEVWVLPGVPRLLHAVLIFGARVRGMRVLRWERADATENCNPTLL
jgi:hypothetical protein